MKTLVLSAVIATASLSAEAATFSYSGNFAGDADVLQFSFTVGALSNITLRSYSYAGGVMSDGTVISAGGFDPILAIFDSTGFKLNEYDDGPDTVPADPVTGSNYDANLVTNSLAAGSYTATIAQYANFSAGANLSDGFTQTSSTFTSTYGCSNGQFCDAGGNNRSNFWAFDVLGAESVTVIDPNPSAVPLPASFPLILAGIGALAIAGRRRRT